QLHLINTSDSAEAIVDKLDASATSQELQVKYEDGVAYRKSIKEYTPTQTHAGAPWKDNGTYLVTGGLGGLGVIFAAAISDATIGANIILTGRSELNAQKQEVLDSLKAKGANVQYKAVDVADDPAVRQLMEEIRQEFNGLNGIIHCAGLLMDSFILKKARRDFSAVLAPKVKGLSNLDLAAADFNLDLFMFCSSTTSVMGNVGQSDYAVANGFMDEYAHYRNKLVASGSRHGHTVAVNWPLWEHGGMSVDADTEKMMFEGIGMAPLKTGEGLQALYNIIASQHHQMTVIYGDTKKLRKTLLERTAPKANSSLKAKANPAATAASPEMREKAVSYLKKQLSSVIKLPVDRIDEDTAMEDYGIDSIMVMQLTNQLEKVFGSLSKTLFFEYQNISELTAFFIEAHTEKLNELLGTSVEDQTTEVAETSAVAAENNSIEPISIKSLRKNRFAKLMASGGVSQESTGTEDIAIIGLSGQYPKSNDLNALWENLKKGENCVTEVPADRWDHSDYFDPDKSKAWKTYTKWGGFIDGVDKFDPLFFNISPKEALTMDPQERLFLQSAYEAIQDAGYTRQMLGGKNQAGLLKKVGVYVGVMWHEYQLYGAQETALGRPMALSSSPSSIANRVSYFCNFNGPSLAMDTMCSSSLTAIHLACQSLKQGECEVALAGGVNVSVHPNKYLVLGYLNIASSKGLCESFGKDGDGYVPSEGVGTVLLKPLSKAIADNDNIYGVIKGTAINHGGKVNGFSVPNPKAQSGAIGQAIKEAGFDARTISYIEAHGTGTALGDPIELAGLTAAFSSKDKKFCSIGSVKSNLRK
ncbi:MAG: type I polyketide synthase, partial [Bacteroidota bacterium]